MIHWPSRKRCTPIGIDFGARSIKLIQFGSERDRVIDAVRHDLTSLPEQTKFEEISNQLAEALPRALEGRAFRGRDAVVCLNDRHLFLQNLRVPKQPAGDFDRAVTQEAAGRLPFGVADAEIRFIESTDIRQGDTVMREVILFACQRSILQQLLGIVEQARLNPVAVDVEPAALVRSYAGQFRREQDTQQRALMVHVGYSRTAAVIAQGDELLFVKYIDLGGQHFDNAVARHLKMDLADATSLRKHNGNRRNDRQDPEITRSINDAIRPITERLASELAMCVRYHSVTFRGQPLTRMVLGGGEATQALLEGVSKQLDLKCELSDPFRALAVSPNIGRKGQWDVAAGLALRNLN